jgi:hypothetical protein
MLETQTEKQFVNGVVNQSARQTPSGRLSRNDDRSKGFHTHRCRRYSEPAARLTPAYTGITTAPQHAREVGAPPVVSEFSDPNPFRV